MAIRFSMGLILLAAIACASSLRGQEAHSSADGRHDELFEEMPADMPCAAAPSCAANSPCDAGMRPLCISPNWWGGAEYLLLWTPGIDVPALATSGSANDALPAAIGQPGTQVLFGDDSLGDSSRSGGRFTIGRWFDPGHCRGVEVSYLTLGDDDDTFSASNSDFAVLGRPFFNTVTGAQDARLIANPGLVSGTLNILASTDFETAEVLYRRSGWSPSAAQIDLVIGYRYAELDDLVRIDEATLALGGPTAGTSFDLFDQFDVRNTFHGGELGLALSFCESPCWSWEIVAKVALGESSHRATVSGQTVTTDSMGNVATVRGGLLSAGTNIGTYDRDETATLSELGITLRRELRCGWAVTIGGTFLYWSDVARAGDQIDATVNPTQIPPGMLTGAARPAFPFRTTDFWAQGLRVGVERNY
jgi:hypothetical protein